jgi:hypothetical protein
MAMTVPLTWTSVAQHDTRRSARDTVVAESDGKGGLAPGVDAAVSSVIGPVLWVPLRTVVAIDGVLAPATGAQPTATLGALIDPDLLRAEGFTDTQIGDVADASVIVIASENEDDATARARGVALAPGTVTTDDVAVVRVPAGHRTTGAEFFVSPALAETLDLAVSEQSLVGTVHHLITRDEQAAIERLRADGVPVAIASPSELPPRTPTALLVSLFSVLALAASWPQLRTAAATGHHTWSWMTPLAAGAVARLFALLATPVILGRLGGSFGFDWRLSMLLNIVPAVVVLLAEAIVASRAVRLERARQ